MDIGLILKSKFPDIDFLHQVQLKDEGKGPFISKWEDSLGTFPTDEILAQWAEEIETQQANNDVKAQLQELDLKTIRALREGNTDRLRQLEEQAAQLRGKLIS